MSFVLGESNLSHGTWDTILNNKLAHERKPFLSYPYAHSSYTIFLSSISQVKPKEAIFVFACYDQGFMFILLSSTNLFLWICNLIVLNHDFGLIVVTGITSFLEQTSLIISSSDPFRKLISRHKPTKSAQLEDPFCSTFLFAKKSKIIKQMVFPQHVESRGTAKICIRVKDYCNWMVYFNSFSAQCNNRAGGSVFGSNDSFNSSFSSNFVTNSNRFFGFKQSSNQSLFDLDSIWIHPIKLMVYFPHFISLRPQLTKE